MSILIAMAGLSARRRIGERLLVLGLFALVSIVAPLLHHDFDRELQSKIHCDACVAATGAARIEPTITLVGHSEPVRQKAPESVQATGRAERPQTPGRAPPGTAISA